MSNRSLEKDIKATPWIVDKIRGNRIYAQNLYAALCNTQFIPNEVWPLLKGDDYWSCTWRYAGGLIAEIRKEGDYMDWYCSGAYAPEQITPPEDVPFLTEEEQQIYHERLKFVPEACIVNEVREDLLKLGWIAVPYPSTD